METCSLYSLYGIVLILLIIYVCVCVYIFVCFDLDSLFHASTDNRKRPRPASTETVGFLILSVLFWFGLFQNQRSWFGPSKPCTVRLTEPCTALNRLILGITPHYPFKYHELNKDRQETNAMQDKYNLKSTKTHYKDRSQAIIRQTKCDHLSNTSTVDKKSAVLLRF